MNKNTLLILAVVAIGVYVVYRMSKSTATGTSTVVTVPGATDWSDVGIESAKGFFGWLTSMWSNAKPSDQVASTNQPTSNLDVALKF